MKLTKNQFIEKIKNDKALTPKEKSFLENSNFSLNKLTIFYYYVGWLNEKGYQEDDIIKDIKETINMKPKEMGEKEFDNILSYLCSPDCKMFQNKRKKYIINLSLKVDSFFNYEDLKNSTHFYSPVNNNHLMYLYYFLLTENFSWHLISFLTRSFKQNKDFFYCFLYVVNYFLRVDDRMLLFLDYEKNKEDSLLYYWTTSYELNSINSMDTLFKYENRIKEILNLKQNLECLGDYKIDYFELLMVNDKCQELKNLIKKENNKNLYELSQNIYNMYNVNNPHTSIITHGDYFSYKVIKYNFGEEESKLLSETARTFGTKIIVDVMTNFVECFLSDKSTLSIKMYTTNKIYNLNNQIYTMGERKAICEIVIFKDEGIYISSNKKRLRPLTFKDITYYKSIYPEIFVSIFDFYMDKNNLLKDIYQDIKNFNNKCIFPLSVNDAMKYHSKKEMLNTEYKTASQIHIDWNKFNINCGYMAIKSFPYLNEKSKKILENTNFNKINFKFTFWGRNWKENVKNFLAAIIYENIQKYSPQDIEKYNSSYKKYNDEYDMYMNSPEYKEIFIRIKDYVQMCFLVKEKVRLDIRSYGQLMKLHDNVEKERYKTCTSTVKVPKNSVFNNLRKILPNDFVWIKSKKRLIEETVWQQHCVWSYADAITCDYCAIYSYYDKTGQFDSSGENEPKLYTIEFRKNRNKYCIEQVQGKRNSENTTLLRKHIQSILDKAS